MTVELTKEMAMDMVMGTQPGYELLEELSYILDYSDQYGRYTWHKVKLEKMSIEGLYNLYKRIK